MQNGKVTSHTFEFGDFVNDLPESCTNCAASQDAFNLTQSVAAETARSAIRQALTTWP